ncbi:glutathione S-transferase family protein [Ketobacter sp.]|uniref:glutathione S-transferase family protein n=1 Tax=Ketobacter sp. TaxID=2083498 RepID=UPI000F299114|nr:glutathione S-transferase family protein [Ketobacter sp.]RLU00729.1 MAG: glutathione S-transferase family protein [Ketobacter sp.]
MFTIYGYNTFNPIKVLLTAEELGLDYTYVNVELGKGENKLPDYLARHPLGKVPALDHDGEILLESAAICRYLARLHDHRLYAADPLPAARIDALVDTATLHVGRWLAVYFWEEVICRHFFKREPNAAAIDEAAGFLKNQLPYFEQQLASADFLCGSEVTLADTIAYAYFQIQDTTSIDLSAYPHIVRWYGEFSERPSVAAVKQRLAEAGGLLPYP